jgi:hypothetical protein
MTTTTAAALIPRLDRVFATHGIPLTIVSDNGPPFDGAKFCSIYGGNSIHRQRTTPLWPQTNAEAERFMKPLLKAIQIAHSEGSLQKAVCIDVCRNSVHTTYRLIQTPVHDLHSLIIQLQD